MIRILKFLIMVLTVIISIAQCGRMEQVEPEVSKQTPHQEVQYHQSTHQPGWLVVDLIDGATDSQLEAVESILDTDLEWSHPAARDEALAVGQVNDLAQAIADLQNHPYVEVAEERFTVSATGLSLQSYPNDPMYDKQWHMTDIGSEYAWANSPRGKGVIVAVIDTGVYAVEDLAGTHVLPGMSFIDGEDTDGNGHGTHCAGTIAQTTNNGIGTTGVAPDASILPVKVLSDHGFGSIDSVAAGIDWAADNGAQVLSMSLGSAMPSKVIHNAIKKATAKGVIIIAAAGNDGCRGCVGFPGGYEEVVGVSSYDCHGNLAWYSSYGEGVDIAAPGGDSREKGCGVLQNTVQGRNGKGEGYYEFQGTSMATPHVSGAAAVLLSAGVPADQVVERLYSTARGGDSWDEKFGHGKLDLAAALGGSSSGCVGSSGMDTTESLSLTAAATAFVLILSWLGRVRLGFMVPAALTASFFSSGLWFLHYLPLPDWRFLEVLSHPFLTWPDLFLDGSWASFPLWLSAFLPLSVGFVFGPHRWTRTLALGFLVGIGTHLLWGASNGSLDPWGMPNYIGALWLLGNAALCAVMAMSIVGIENMEK